MLYDTKIAIVVRSDLAPWQKLNVTAFLAGGLAGERPHIIGEPYVDASQRQYNPLIREPIFVFQADLHELTRTLERAMRRGCRPAIYTEELFATTNDADNRAAVSAVTTEELNLVGLGLHEERKATDKIVKGLTLHE
jgi:hypothetical protein